MIRAVALRSGRGTLALALVCALLVFTTGYRHCSGFSPATATRCHSLSTDHTDAQALFDGDFGPLAIVTVAIAAVAAAVVPVDTAPEPRVIGVPRPALVLAPYRRPPPPSVV